ncbi:MULTISPECIES: hypothetical protein [unclassified Streptomyces]|nr:hypothetical protein [Streptomyces sp. NBC_01429]
MGPGLSGVYLALAGHGKPQAYPEAVAPDGVLVIDHSDKEAPTCQR